MQHVLNATRYKVKPTAQQLEPRGVGPHDVSCLLKGGGCGCMTATLRIILAAALASNNCSSTTQARGNCTLHACCSGSIWWGWWVDHPLQSACAAGCCTALWCVGRPPVYAALLPRGRAATCGCYALKQRSDSVLFREAMRASVTPPNSSSRRFGPATWGGQQRQGQARLGGEHT